MDLADVDEGRKGGVTSAERAGLVELRPKLWGSNAPGGRQSVPPPTLASQSGGNGIDGLYWKCQGRF